MNCRMHQWVEFVGSTFCSPRHNSWRADFSGARNLVTWTGFLAILILGTALAGGQDKAEKLERTVSPWFIYQGEASIQQLKPNADIISSISVCGGCPRAFVDQCHALGIDVYLLKGGHDGAVFEGPSARRELIRSYLDECRATGADGIDLDFESLDKKHRGSYSELLRDADQAFGEAGKKLSMCVSYVMCTWRSVAGPKPGSDDIDGGWYDPAVIGETCDIVRVMCYDMHSPSAGGAVGPVSTAPWARDAMRYWSHYVPPRNLVMGLPAYSRDFAMTSRASVESVYAPLPPIGADRSLKRFWFPYEQISQYHYTDSNGILHLFFASDELSTRAHLSTACELDLKRVGFWHYGAVTAKEWQEVRKWVRAEE